MTDNRFSPILPKDVIAKYNSRRRRQQQIVGLFIVVGAIIMILATYYPHLGLTDGHDVYLAFGVFVLLPMSISSVLVNRIPNCMPITDAQKIKIEAWCNEIEILRNRVTLILAEHDHIIQCEYVEMEKRIESLKGKLINAEREA